MPSARTRGLRRRPRCRRPQRRSRWHRRRALRRRSAPRAAAYLRYVDRRRALIVIVAAALTTALGAYGYTLLTNAGAALVIGAMLVLSAPLRRSLRGREVRIGDAGLGAGAIGYGVVVGGTSGAGVILLFLR